MTDLSNIAAIFKKQLKDTFKNKTVFIQFIMFPVLAQIMSRAVKIEGMPENFFVTLFASMYIGMAPLTSMAAVIAEEKEKNTLRVLLLSNVKPYEYLLGVGSYIWSACLLGAAVICAAGHYRLRESAAFMMVMAMGIFASLLLGAAIGTFSKTQMTATSITVPVMMIFSFMPMLSLFNATIAKIAKYFYSEQISLMLNQINPLQLEGLGSSFAGNLDSAGHIGIVAANMLLFAALFTMAYKKSGFE